MTTWETYNYILFGYVNELVCLGCKEELVLATLQLWSAYLRKNEIAFYGKSDMNLPKFPFKYNQRSVLHLEFKTVQNNSIPNKQKNYFFSTEMSNLFTVYQLKKER